MSPGLSISHGRLIVSTSSRHIIEGDSPPCIQKIDYEISAAGGMQLKQLTKEFHSFRLNRDLPIYKSSITLTIKAIS
jgi:hypothetical protein